MLQIYLNLLISESAGDHCLKEAIQDRIQYSNLISRKTVTAREACTRDLHGNKKIL